MERKKEEDDFKYKMEQNITALIERYEPRVKLKEVTVSIERQGYQPWTRTLTPVTGMKIQPALVALPPAAKPDTSETK